MSSAQREELRGRAAIKNLDVLESELLGEPLRKDAVPEFSKEELNAVISAITEEFKRQYDLLDDRMKKLSLSIEKNRIVADVKTAAVSGGKSVHARTLNPVSPMDRLAEEYRNKLEIPANVRLRFVNNHSTLRPLRRSQGYEPVLDKGAEVQHVDVVLMKIPQERYRQEVLDPRADRGAAIRGGLENSFDEEVREAGAKPIGTGIAYDEGAKSPSKE